MRFVLLVTTLASVAMWPGSAAAQGAPSPALAAALANPCSLVSQTEAQGFLGDPGMLPPQSSTGVVPMCAYADNGGNHLVQLSIYNTSSVRGLSSPDAQPVAGLNVENYCDPHTSSGGDVADLHAAIDSVYTLQVVEEQGFLTCDVAAEFAQAALGRLASGDLATLVATSPPVAGGLLDNAMAYPCSIVTTDEASAIFGVAMQTTASPGADNPACQWHGGNVVVSVSIYSDGVGAGEQDIGPSTPVTGLGTEAACNATNSSGELVVAIDNGHYLGVTGILGNVTCAQEQQFAQIALTRL